MNKTGYIYIIKCNLHDRAYKIGQTVNLKKRKSEYNKNLQIPKQNYFYKWHKKDIGHWEYIYTKKTNIPSEIVENYILSSIQHEFDPMQLDDYWEMCESDEWNLARIFIKNDKDFIEIVDKYANEILTNKKIREIETLKYIAKRYNISEKYFRIIN